MKNRFKRTTLILLAALLVLNIVGIFAYATNPGWGRNAFSFGKDLAWWGALTVIAVFVVKYMAKRAWAQVGGLAVLGAVVLVIIDDPERLKNIGLTVWNFVFR